MKCNSCGANVADTAKFCEYCGTRLAVPVSEPAVEPVIEHTSEPIIETPAEAPSVPVEETVAVAAEPAAEDVQVTAENTEHSKADTAREQAYLNYEKKLQQMRQHQTDAAMAAVPVAVITEEATAAAVGEGSLPAITEEILPPQPNAVVMAGKSGFFTAANVLFTINTVLTALVSIGSVLLGTGGAIAAIIAISEYFGVDISAYIDAVVGDTMGVAILIGLGVTILANIPGILINIGLLTTSSACKRSNGESIRPTGLKLIRFISVLGLIFTVLFCAALLCVSIFFIVGDPYTKAMGITLLTLTVIAIIIMVFCFAKLLASLNKVIDTAQGQGEKKASTFLGVLCIIVAVFSLANIIACLALVFYAVTLFKYNSIVNSRNAC